MQALHTFQKVIWLLTMFLRRYAYRCHTALNAVQRWEVNQMEDKAHWEDTDETVWDAKDKDSGEEFEIFKTVMTCGSLLIALWMIFPLKKANGLKQTAN